MLNSTLGATHDATVGNDNLSQPTVLVTEPQAPALITEQEVMLGTAAALARRSPRITHRIIDAFHVVGAALRPPPPRPHYAYRAAYLERAAMAREMDRL